MRSYERYDYDGQRLVILNELTAADLDEIADRAIRELMQARSSAFTAWNGVRLLHMWIDSPQAPRGKRDELIKAWIQATPVLIERLAIERGREFAVVAVEAVLRRIQLAKEPTDKLQWWSPADSPDPAPDTFFERYSCLMLNALNDAVQFELLKTDYGIEVEARTELDELKYNVFG